MRHYKHINTFYHMKKNCFIILAVAATMLCACHKHGGDEPAPGPEPQDSEITSNNAAPGGFTDEGPVTWDE